ncbi:peptidylprolyl isomerase [Corynebacterium vitaeruminis]|uniref:peptidylprolyl isomerase n=1 Tax=Corynebacterium vitaeruminis TaxID=38305 RepID=UPI0023F71DDB|nr:peptidylprolyl isomerase [Corynebacterium vitaeruminis]
MSSNKERREQSLRALEKEIKSRDRAEKTRPLGVAAAAAVAIAVIVGGIVYLNNQSNDNKAENTAAATTSATADYQPLALTRSQPLGDTVTCSYPASGTAAKAVDAPATENVSATGTVTVTLQTNKGDIPMELDRSVSPCTVNAVEHLAQAGYYDDTVCHRLTTQGIYVLQCGDPTGQGSGGPGFQFANEYPTDEATDTNTPVIYPRGSIAMANAGQDTNGSQFFLNYQDSPLPPMYTYFGQISDTGLATLDSIAAAGVQDGGSDGAPAEEVRITKAVVAS